MGEVQASVIIRTWNALDLVRATVLAVRAQTPPFPFELVCVDSGSTDGTREFLQEMEQASIAPTLRVVDLPPADFSYGGSLNVGARASRGEILVLLSQDATPAHAYWLDHLVAPLLSDPGLCATFGRQSPRHDANPVEAHDLSHVYGNQEAQYDSLPPFSSANGALRRSLWEDVPFDETLPFSEDQAWAQAQSEAGWSVAYVPKAEVLHSHALGLADVYRRCIEQARGEAQLGYRAPTVFGQCRVLLHNLHVHAVGLLRDHRVRFHVYVMVYRATQLFGAWVGHRRGRHEAKSRGA